jgi:hypothetical protein
VWGKERENKYTDGDHTYSSRHMLVVKIPVIHTVEIKECRTSGFHKMRGIS